MSQESENPEQNKKKDSQTLFPPPVIIYSPQYNTSSNKSKIIEKIFDFVTDFTKNFRTFMKIIVLLFIFVLSFLYFGSDVINKALDKIFPESCCCDRPNSGLNEGDVSSICREIQSSLLNSNNLVKHTIEFSNDRLGSKIVSELKNSNESLSNELLSAAEKIINIIKKTRVDQGLEQMDNHDIDKEEIYDFLNMLLDRSGNAEISVEGKPSITISIDGEN